MNTISTTTSTSSSQSRLPPAVAQNVLVLNSFRAPDPKSWKQALLLDSSGRKDVLECFKHGQKTQAYHSCSLTWNNEFFIFGGYDYKRQISKLSGYHLKNVGSLKFDHNYGTCANMANKKLFLCFNDDSIDHKKCRWASDPLGPFFQATLATHKHHMSRISSSNGKLFASRVR